MKDNNMGLKSDERITSLTDQMDGTVLVKIGGLHLCRMTPRSEQTLTDNPFYWGNKVKAIQELLAWETEQRDLKNKELIEQQKGRYD